MEAISLWHIVHGQRNAVQLTMLNEPLLALTLGPILHNLWMDLEDLAGFRGMFSWIWGMMSSDV